MSQPTVCSHCGAGDYTLLKPLDPDAAEALRCLSAAIEAAHTAFRRLPPERWDNARQRGEVQFHLNAAGRDLAKAYDALRVLSRVSR